MKNTIPYPVIIWYARSMNMRLLGTVVGILVIGGVVAYVAFMGRAAQAPIDLSTLTTPLPIAPLPSSPLNSTIQIENTEVTLAEGSAETDIPDSSAQALTKVVGEPVYGDVNDDGVDDAVFVITHSEGGTGTFYYVATALKSDLGYLGTNAVLLGDRIAVETVKVANGVIKVHLKTRGEGQSFADTPIVPETKYVVLMYPLLAEVALDGAEYVEGVLSYSDDRWMFVVCNGATHTVSSDSRSFAVLEAIFTARSTGNKPVFMTVLAKNVDSGAGSSLDVMRVLTVPTQDTCSTLPREAPPLGEEVTQPEATTTLDSSAE